MDILAHLNSLADRETDYREFNKRIIATGREVLGVRMPDLRKFARRLASCAEVEDYLMTGPDRTSTNEEVLLYGLVLAARAQGRGCVQKMPLERVLALLDGLIAQFDSWAHVDVIISEFKIFSRHRDEVLRHFMPLKTHSGEFEKRTFAILLMDFFMNGESIGGTLKHLAEIPQGQYYVDMAIAWALAEALVRDYDATVAVLEGTDRGDSAAVPVFSKFVHNKAIQKARESFRIAPEQKVYLNTLKIK